MEPQKASQFLDLIRNYDLEMLDIDTSQKGECSFVSIVTQQILKAVSKFNLDQSSMGKLKATLTESGTQISYLEQQLFEVFTTDHPCVIMIGSDGSIINEKWANNAIFVDLKTICFELLSGLPFLKSTLVLESLTINEQIALEHLRNDDFNSVKVIKRNGKLDRIESRQSINTSKRVIDVMKEAEYQDIEIKQESGKAVHINRVIKTKL